MVLRELDALESDTKIYLISAARIDALEYLWVYVALPALSYGLFINAHERFATVIGLGWLVVVLVHLIGVPFRRGDRSRGQALLRQLRDLREVLGNPPISPTRLHDSLNRAVAAGVVLDASVLALVDRVIARDATVFVPA